MPASNQTRIMNTNAGDDIIVALKCILSLGHLINGVDNYIISRSIYEIII